MDTFRDEFEGKTNPLGCLQVNEVSENQAEKVHDDA
jgi:hypothetical protein